MRRLSHRGGKDEISNFRDDFHGGAFWHVENEYFPSLCPNLCLLCIECIRNGDLHVECKIN